MQLSLTKKEQLQISVWSGGTTTQLIIYPKEAVYKNLDFTFRISTATIDVEESAFTSLPNVNRVIMVLKGELTIQHKNHYVKQLKKFDTDNFSGDWKTTGIGKVTDFNVMTRGSARANVSGFFLPDKSTKEFFLHTDIMAVYVSAGEILIEQTLVSQGDILLIQKENNNEKLILLAQRYSELAIAYISI